MVRRAIPATPTLVHSTIIALSLGIVGAAEDSREVQTQPQLRSPFLLCLDFANDSSLVATGGSHIYIHKASGQQIARVSPPSLTRAVAFSPTETDVLASGGDDGVVRVWRVGRSEPLHAFRKHSGMIMDLAFSPDGKLLASCASGILNGNRASGELVVRNVETGEIVHPVKYPAGGIDCLAFSPTGDRLAFARNPGKSGPAIVDLCDASSWKRIQRVSFAPGFALSVAIAPNENKLVIAGGECVPLTPSSCRPTGYIWIAELASEQPPQRLGIEAVGYFRSVSFVSGGELFATGEHGEGVQLWSTLTRQVVWATGRASGDPYGATISPDGRLVAACWASGEIELFDARNGNPVRSLVVERP